ncbi:MAG: hypothetical protein NZ957_02725 [Thaumarchaeota archaeon]|nr:hypothetical protein [Candidatus Calditenuaceae archaeon]MDW8042522.1 hypothetical protein [Nitrososphaerota archaeon]
MSPKERMRRIKSETSELSDEVRRLRDLYERGELDRDAYISSRFKAEVIYGVRVMELVEEAFAPVTRRTSRPSRSGPSARS